MKKILLTLFLFNFILLPVFADLIVPSMTDAARQEFINRRHNYHLEIINRVCGGVTNLEEKECKALLKKDYEVTFKYFESFKKVNKDGKAE